MSESWIIEDFGGRGDRCSIGNSFAKLFLCDPQGGYKVVKRPNKTVLIEALDEFRDAMRPFIVRGMRRIRGKPIEKVIYDSLAPNRANRFQTNLRNNDSTLGSAIDIGDFPDIIGTNYQGIFSPQFRGDTPIKSLLHIIRHARNQVSHPSDTDLDTEYTRVVLYHIIEVLDKINAIEAKASVERRRDTLCREQALASLQDTSSAPEQRHTQTNVPPPRPSRRPSISLRFIVTVPDGERIERDTISATFVAVIEKLGIERVKACNIERFYVPIVDTVKHEKHTQVQSGPYYILTAQDRQDKKRDLLKIAAALGIELKVEMPSRNEVV